MLKFARLSQLSKSPQVIMSALKKSTSGLMEVSESTSKIRRSKDKPIPEETAEFVAEVKARTVYCKGFPKEGTTIDKLLDFFKAFPTVLNVKVCYLMDFFNLIINTKFIFRCVITKWKNKQ